jgi:FkbM family methyltransferase
MGAAKAKLEESARGLLYGSGLFFPLRSGYQFFFDRDKMAFRRRMRDFYAAFVRPGDTVFDVGANIGWYSEVFAELGAKVVAVEPNPYCWQKLDRLARVRNVLVQRCAAGDVPGKLSLHVCEESGLSTVTEHWYKAAQQSPLHRHAKWTGTREVDVVTVDQLADRYGIPNFVKIDVEGYDDHVLRGMSFRPSALQFERNRDIPQVALRCLQAPAFADGYEFNYVRGLEMQLASKRWMRADALRDNLSSLAGDAESGDVLARRES